MKYDFTYLSLGAGVQSSALLVMSNLGLHGCPRADVAIFADTQSEPPWVYEQVERLKKWSKIPVHVITFGNLEKAIHNNAGASRSTTCEIPFWVPGQDGKAAPIRRQCTSNYKIRPIVKYVRQILWCRGRPVKKKVRCLIGISLDEITRMKPSREYWITNDFPLVNAGLRRDDCQRILKDNGVPMPEKSACYFCPYRDDAGWQDMKERHPDQFARAVEYDKQIRGISTLKVKRPFFISQSLQPLGEVDFEARIKKRTALPMFDSFTEECSGHCGV